MRWSRLKSLVKNKFAPSVKYRVSINSTRYGSCTCGRAWLTLDGEEIANFCTRAYYNAKLGSVDTSSRKMDAMLVNYGDLSRQDAYESCWAFVHDLSIQEALKDTDPLVQALAVLDARLGKRRLAQIRIERLHPLAQKLLHVRIEAENTRARD